MKKVAVLFAVALGGACSSPNSPSPTPNLSPGAPSSPAPPPPSSSTLYSVTGIVTDQTGSPLAGAVVEVDYIRGGAFSRPPANCPVTNGCWIAVRTDAAGHYAFEFEPGTGLVHGNSEGAGDIYSFLDGYETNTQLLPRGTSAVVMNLRLRRLRTVNPGPPVTVTIESDSSLCSDLEDLWMLDKRCENIEVVAGTTGRLTVDARAADAGGTTPIVFFSTSGEYTTAETLGPGTASVGVKEGQHYRVYVGVPREMVGRYDVTTSVR